MGTQAAVTLVLLLLLVAALGTSAAPYAPQSPFFGAPAQPKGKCDCSQAADSPPVVGNPGTPPMVAVERTLQRQCDLVDPTACLDTSGDGLDGETDFVVVGSGTAGSVLACRLSEDGRHRVTLLEAGPPAPAAAAAPSLYHAYEGTVLDWNYELEKDPNSCLASTCRWPRGRVVGGTSVLHGMMYMRGHPWDYDRWAQSGCSRWSWKDVLPYFLRSEDNLDVKRRSDFVDPSLHGTDGPMTVERFKWQPQLVGRMLQAASQLGQRVGHDPNGGAGQLGFTPAQATTVLGARSSLLRQFCGGSARRPNLSIVTRAQVTRVLVDPQSKRATGVEYVRKGKTRRLMAAKEVILSAGTVASPQILLLSGIGPKEHLQKVGIPVIHHLPGVGRRLQNHVSYKMRVQLNNWKQEALLTNGTLHEYVKKRVGPITSTGMSQLTGFIRTKYAPQMPASLPDVQIFFAGEQANGSSVVSSSSPPAYIDIVPTLLRPESRGYLELRSKDPFQPPRIFAQYFRDTFDVKVLIEGVRFVLEFVRTPAMRELGANLTPELTQGCERYVAGSDDFWACAVKRYTGPENHQVGTCQMGDPYDPNTVVDPQLRVVGIKNLRVVDASIMPHVPSGNINAPIVMVAEKGAQMIRDDWH
ncbi:glucose dehydrogenase [FAD, quinone]-like [Schistocerca americana]|uniref:glucose dehydrogenase [FAD, quinone]-like n=1 Tax=Schistocerca americana TaxID=7009 RepID=UPI001F4F74FC|nr:glucose dehydrogenase [FAD, quinone]-like [Schistocerca americana]